MAVYKASCHCGKVRYEVEAELDNLATCNCSLCGRSGAILAFMPRSKVSNLEGEDALTDYQFGKKTIHHSFCSVCGMRPIAFGNAPDGEPFVAVNVRCFEGVDAAEVKVARTFDGKSL